MLPSPNHCAGLRKKFRAHRKGIYHLHKWVMEQWRTDLLSLPSVLSITFSLTSPAGGTLLENVAVDKMFFLPCHVPGLPIWWLFWDSVVKTVFLQICLEKWRDPILLSSWENPGALARATEEKGYCFRQTGVSKPGVERMFFTIVPCLNFPLADRNIPSIAIAFLPCSNIQNYSTPSWDV